MKETIGNLAGEVYHFLEDSGQASLSDIAENVNGPRSKVNMAIGWLAREEKLIFDDNGRGTTVSLK